MEEHAQCLFYSFTSYRDGEHHGVRLAVGDADRDFLNSAFLGNLGGGVVSCQVIPVIQPVSSALRTASLWEQERPMMPYDNSSNSLKRDVDSDLTGL